ncbi:RHS repeat-associated core domain-containing protein, partial [Paenibacillus tarimensis]|nr:hypothetical protein [Paenibacillus tarimensis]
MKVTFPNGFGESYTYDMFGRRMTKSQFNHTGSIQETMKYHYKGDTYVITDEKNSAGETAASYTFSESGRPLSRVYNRYGERVREGIGWMGDLNTGNGSPGSRQGPEDESGNTAPDYHPGIGNAPAASSAAASETDTTAGTADTTAAETEDALAWLEETDAAVQETADITTELVKYNPYRYAGYYWDRKTQLYFLQARYYDPRNGRFLSA